MFAVSGSSVQALDILNRMLARGEVTDQANKDRAAKFAMLKVQSDERELDRLNSMVMTTQKQVTTLETEFAKMGGMRDSMGEDPKSEGQSIAQANLYNLATDAKGARQSLTDLQFKRDQLIGNISAFSDAALRYSPDVFKEYSEQDASKKLYDRSVISEEEWQAFKEGEGKGYTDIQLRGIRAGMQGMSKEKFDMLAKERQLNQMDAQIAAAKAKNAQANATQPWIDRIKQWRQSQTHLGSEDKFGPEGGFTPSDVLTKAGDFSEALFSITDELARFAEKGEDWWETSDKLEGLFSAWKDAKSISDPDLMAAAAMGIQQHLRTPGVAKGELDYSLFKGDQEELGYIAHLIRGIDLYAGAQEATFPGSRDGIAGIYDNMLTDYMGKVTPKDEDSGIWDYVSSVATSVVQSEGMKNAPTPWSNMLQGLDNSGGEQVVGDVIGKSLAALSSANMNLPGREGFGANLPLVNPIQLGAGAHDEMMKLRQSAVNWLTGHVPTFKFGKRVLDAQKKKRGKKK